jgi:hypothetical protein
MVSYLLKRQRAGKGLILPRTERTELMGSATWPVKPRGVAVEPSGSERDTMQRMGCAAWPMAWDHDLEGVFNSRARRGSCRDTTLNLQLSTISSAVFQGICTAAAVRSTYEGLPRGCEPAIPGSKALMKFVSLRRKRVHGLGKPSRATHESFAKPTPLHHQIHTYAELRQQIHDDLRIQHPEWVEPDGKSPMCDSYEARLMELLDGLSRRESTQSIVDPHRLLEWGTN